MRKLGRIVRYCLVPVFAFLLIVALFLDSIIGLFVGFFVFLAKGKDGWNKWVDYWADEGLFPRLWYSGLLP